MDGKTIFFVQYEQIVQYADGNFKNHSFGGNIGARLSTLVTKELRKKQSDLVKRVENEGETLTFTMGDG